MKFDFEITLLTVSAVDGVHFCAPIGHRQEDGDYRESWQPQQMSALALERAQEIAGKTVVKRWAVTACSAWSCLFAATR